MGQSQHSRSTSGDWVFALLSLGTVCILIFLGLQSGPTWQVATRSYCGVWFFLVARMHLHVAWMGGLGAFGHLVRRFPATWVNTAVYHPLFFTFKLLGFLVCELLLLDPVGQVYKCKGEGITFERYCTMATDLEKPLIWREAYPTNFAIYPFLLSTRVAANIYSLGPYTGFGVLTTLVGKSHVVFRNGLLGTHPAFNYHVTIFFDDEKGEAYWHTAHALTPGWLQVYQYLWNFYAERMFDLIVASEKHGRGAARASASASSFDETWRPHSTIPGRLACSEGQCEIRHEIVTTKPASGKVALNKQQ